MTAVDLTAQLNDWIREAIDTGCMGEEYAYTVLPALVRLGSVQLPAWAVLVLTRSPVLNGTPLVNKLDIPTAIVATGQQDQVTAAVHQALGNLRKQHADALQALKTGN